MTADELASVTLEHLRAMRADIGDIKERLAGVEFHLAAMGQQLGALTAAVYGGKSDLDRLTRRVERIERRLELNDTTH